MKINASPLDEFPPNAEIGPSIQCSIVKDGKEERIEFEDMRIGDIVKFDCRCSGENLIVFLVLKRVASNPVKIRLGDGWTWSVRVEDC